MEKLSGNFNSQDLAQAVARLAALAIKSEKTAPALSGQMKGIIPERLTAMRFADAQRKRLRTSNMSENLNRQIKRRQWVVGLFPTKNRSYASFPPS